MFRRRGKRPRRGELTAFIDEGSEMEGRYTFRGTVMLNGRFKGEIASGADASAEDEAELKPLRIVLVDGEKDHGTGEHDYPAWKKVWTPLLAKAALTTVDAARGIGFPVPRPTLRVLVGTELRPAVDAALSDWSGAEPAFFDPPSSYYEGLRFQMDLPHEGGLLPLIDGGMVDWVARLRSDRKEKCLVGAVGTELLVRLWPTTGR